MSTHTCRAFRPVANELEGRLCLSATVTAPHAPLPAIHAEAAPSKVTNISLENLSLRLGDERISRRLDSNRAENLPSNAEIVIVGYQRKGSVMWVGIAPGKNVGNNPPDFGSSYLHAGRNYKIGGQLGAFEFFPA